MASSGRRRPARQTGVFFFWGVLNRGRALLLACGCVLRTGPHLVGTVRRQCLPNLLPPPDQSKYLFFFVRRQSFPSCSSLVSYGHCRRYFLAQDRGTGQRHVCVYDFFCCAHRPVRTLRGACDAKPCVGATRDREILPVRVCAIVGWLPGEGLRNMQNEVLKAGRQEGSKPQTPTMIVEHAPSPKHAFQKN